MTQRAHELEQEQPTGAGLLHSTGAAALAGSEDLPRPASTPAAAPAILPARAQFRTFKRTPRPDPRPGVITPEERQHIDDRVQSGVCPHAHLIRKIVRLCDERKLVLDRVRRVVDQARQYPSKYPGRTTADFLDNILRGDDDLG